MATEKTVVGPTPAGGVKSTAYFLDERSQPCEAAEAFEVRILEFNSAGSVIQTTYAVTARGKAAEERDATAPPDADVLLAAAEEIIDRCGGDEEAAREALARLAEDAVAESRRDDSRLKALAENYSPGQPRAPDGKFGGGGVSAARRTAVGGAMAEAFGPGTKADGDEFVARLHGRLVFVTLKPGSGVASITFSHAGTSTPGGKEAEGEYFTSAKELQAGTMELARKLKALASALASRGVGVAYEPSDARRERLYEAALSAAGLEKTSSRKGQHVWRAKAGGPTANADIDLGASAWELAVWEWDNREWDNREGP